GDFRRLARRGQEKNVEECVPAFTQHTQFFHKCKICQCKHFPSRKCNESWKKNKNSTTCGETFPKHLGTLGQIRAVENEVHNPKIVALTFFLRPLSLNVEPFELVHAQGISADNQAVFFDDNRICFKPRILRGIEAVHGAAIAFFIEAQECTAHGHPD